jgi:hypothetical protein
MAGSFSAAQRGRFVDRNRSDSTILNRQDRCLFDGGIIKDNAIREYVPGTIQIEKGLLCMPAEKGTPSNNLGQYQDR